MFASFSNAAPPGLHSRTLPSKVSKTRIDGRPDGTLTSLGIDLIVICTAMSGIEECKSRKVEGHSL
jgi:hypothetical protein